MYFVKAEEIADESIILKENTDVLKDEFDYLLETLEKLERSGEISYAMNLVSEIVDQINLSILEGIQKIQTIEE